MSCTAKEWFEQQDRSTRDTLCRWMDQHCSDQEVELEVQVSLTRAQFDALKRQFAGDAEWSLGHAEEHRVDTFVTNTVRRSAWPLERDRASVTIAKTPIGKTSLRVATSTTHGPSEVVLRVACKREHVLASPREVQRAVDLSSALPFSTGTTTRTITRESFTHPLKWLQVSFSSVLTQPQQPQHLPLHTHEVEIEATMMCQVDKEQGTTTTTTTTDTDTQVWSAEQRVWMLFETASRIHRAAVATERRG